MQSNWLHFHFEEKIGRIDMLEEEIILVTDQINDQVEYEQYTDAEDHVFQDFQAPENMTGVHAILKRAQMMTIDYWNLFIGKKNIFFLKNKAINCNI